MQRFKNIWCLPLVAALVALPGSALAEMYVEGYMGGVQGANATVGQSFPGAGCIGFGGLPGGQFNELAVCSQASFEVDGKMRAPLMGGLRIGAWFEKSGWLVGVTAAVALVLVLLIAIVVRVFVLRRLQRFESTARLIAGGDLAQRIPAEGVDTVSWLAREFNAMADSVTGLVGEVRSERERLETVINSIDDGIVVLDTQRKVVAANDAFLRRTGTVRDEAVGCSRAAT